ncbi:hypothetical protein FRB93_007064 [Tulasnella sp. JGI-2019a]|nr:hypothetical protein FRB93_007064 [Tulasnella sp. JGI-2019a]
MVVFSFVPTQKRGFFISSSSSSSWQGIPPPLQTTVKNISDDGQEIRSLSVGLDGSCFVAARDGDVRYGYTNYAPISKAIDAYNTRNPSASLSIDSVSWISFTPDKEGFFAYFVLDDGREKYLAENIPGSLAQALETFDSVSCVSMGRNGSWVILSDDKSMWQGVPKALAERLAQSDPIKSVVLALDDENEFFLEYEDGRFLMILPKAWHETINSHIEGDEEASNAEEVALAAAKLRATKMELKAILQGQQAISDIVNGYSRTECRTRYRTRYEEDDENENEDENEDEDDEDS